MKRLFIVFIIFIFISLSFSNNSFNSLLEDGLVYTNYIKTDINMEIFWEFSSNEHELYMVLRSPQTGWISIGFDPTRRMADAKIIIAGLDNGNFILEEHYGTGQTTHSKINEIYIKRFKGVRNSSYTLVEFVIPLDSSSRYKIFKGNEHTVILGYHDDSDSFIRRHTQRTTINIRF